MVARSVRLQPQMRCRATLGQSKRLIDRLVVPARMPAARMPRWDSSRARPLQLDISFARRQGPLSAAEATAERRRQRQRSRGPQDVRMMEGARPGEGPPPDQWPAGFEYAREADGGLRVIDDADVPAAAYPGGGGGGGSGSGGGLMGAGSWAEHRPQRQQRGGGDFPSLSAAAAGEGGGGGGAGSSRPPPLVKKTVKCPCGRWVAWQARQHPAACFLPPADEVSLVVCSGGTSQC